MRPREEALGAGQAENGWWRGQVLTAQFSPTQLGTQLGGGQTAPGPGSGAQFTDEEMEPGEEGLVYREGPEPGCQGGGTRLGALPSFSVSCVTLEAMGEVSPLWNALL